MERSDHCDHGGDLLAWAWTQVPAGAQSANHWSMTEQQDGMSNKFVGIFLMRKWWR
ncbi:MAG: hypothetical protein R2932_40565 [Caldilineaceae bacterium]